MTVNPDRVFGDGYPVSILVCLFVLILVFFFKFLGIGLLDEVVLM